MIEILLFAIALFIAIRYVASPKVQHRWQYRFVTLGFFARYIATDVKAVWATVSRKRIHPS